MITWLALGGLAVAGILGLNIYRRFGAERIGVLRDARREGSRLVSRGDFYDGGQRHRVALALTESKLFYESDEIRASLDLEWVRAVEYDKRLATGRTFDHGEVLRLRCDNQTFEFVLPADQVGNWRTMLPPWAGAGHKNDPGGAGNSLEADSRGKGGL